MSKKYFVKVVFIAVFTIVFSVSSDAIEKITPALRNVMETSSPEKLIPVSIRMKPQISQIYLQTITAGMAKREKRAAVISELKSFAQRSQAELLDFLRGHERAGQAAHVGSHWLSNGISANLTRKVIEVVADFEEVERISWDRVLPPFEENLTKDRSGLSIKSSSDIAEGVLKINAPGVWDKGYTGQGVLIAIIDSGVDYTHPDLSDHMWDGSGQYYEYPPESGNWFELIHHGFDFVGIDTNNPIADNDPMDENGHGTKAAGIAAGDGISGTHTGVAPDATIMAVKISDDNLDWTEDILIKGLEFAADFGADVISMSWGTAFGISCQSGEYTETPDYARWRNVTSDLLIAEISLACAAGNDGEKLDCSGNNPIKYPLPYNISAPANCPPPWLHPDQTLIGGLGAVTAVGATDLNDNLYSSSSRGPAAWMQIIYSGYPYDIPPEYQDYPWGIGGIEGELIGLLKPDVTAPAGVQSTQLGGGYGSFSGTSAATPHVGGAMALLLSYNPNLTPAQLSQYLQMTSVELGDPGKDNEYGAGRIDACRAIIEAGAWQKGDVNADCDIDALDVTLVVNIILGYVDPTPYQFWTADCNDDEEINVLDVVCIINIINQSGGKSIAWNSDVVPAEVWFGQNTGLTLAKGSRCVLPINIRTKIPIAGIQMVFKLGPNALVPYELKTSSFTKDMKLRYSMKSDRLILVMYGEHGEAFGPGSGTAVEIVFDIDDITNIPQDPNFGLEFGDILLANTNAGIIPLKPRAEAEQNTALPETYTLSQNYPNPFNPETEISFQIPSATYTSLKVFNILGQEVKTLVDAYKEAGHYTITWSGRDESGKEVTSGVYFYTLKAGEFTDTKRMLLLK